MSNPVRKAQELGQSIWYDNISRGLLVSGRLRELVERDGIRGVTSNPAIFQKALAAAGDYDQALRELIGSGGGTAKDIYERLAVADIQQAADTLRPVYEQSQRRDGYVSLEVSPYLAHDRDGTVEEARRLHRAVGRPNLMIKVPATGAGLEAITQLTGEGICVNATLLFSVDRYEQVVRAYMAGLERLLESGGDLTAMASVASFFVSRIDTLVDRRLTALLEAAAEPERRGKLASLMGQAAVACARLAFERCCQLHASHQWEQLAQHGARPQRLLWASTSTKNPNYPKTKYVDQLIGPGTVNTVPTETLDEFLVHGRVPADSSVNFGPEPLRAAGRTIQALAAEGIEIEAVAEELLRDGVERFAAAFDGLLETVERRRQELLGSRLITVSLQLGAGRSAVDERLQHWRSGGLVRRLWQHDATLWTGGEEGGMLGWLHLLDDYRHRCQQLQRIGGELRADRFRHALLLGMGGSSLCPLVLSQTLADGDGQPHLLVLDSTVPAQIRAVERQLDLARTLFIVSSKSGTTVETTALMRYFYDRLCRLIGPERARRQFVAITDPSQPPNPLEQFARSCTSRPPVHGVPSVGGRYSALSEFGLLPAAIMGLDLSGFLGRAELMAHSCAGCVPPPINPGVAVGVALSTLAGQGRDKVTVIASPAIASLALWLEQLLAESTGKDGKGLVPVAGEQIGAPDRYADDRLFVYLRLDSAPSADQDAAVAALERAGQPVVRLQLAEPLDLGQAFFLCEFATAVAGAELGLNPFDQPDVEASKEATRRLTQAYEAGEAVRAWEPFFADGHIRLLADERNRTELEAAGGGRSLTAYLAAHLARLRPGDYFAINAYLPTDGACQQQLDGIRQAVRDGRRVATMLGFGPRFLHSTGQLHKGGPNTGLFLQITADDAEDVSIPQQRLTFGMLKQFQAQGDYEVLTQRGRRALWVHLGPDVEAELKRLRQVLEQAMHA